MANKQLSSVVQVRNAEKLEEELLWVVVDASYFGTILADHVPIERMGKGKGEKVCQSSDNVGGLCSAV